jgi:hypothetical protein
MTNISCPASTGKSLIHLSSPLSKNISLLELVETAIERMGPTPKEGRLAIVTNVGVGCDGRGSVRRANSALDE